VCISVLEHVGEEVPDVIREIGRVVKPGGHAVITCDLDLRREKGLLLEDLGARATCSPATSSSDRSPGGSHGRGDPQHRSSLDSQPRPARAQSSSRSRSSASPLEGRPGYDQRVGTR
jgi:SAM-dependent methyltransferase